MKNELYNVTKSKLQKQEEYIKNNINKSLDFEREKYGKLEDNYYQLQVKIKCLDNENNLLNEKLNKLEDEQNHRKEIEDQYNEMANTVIKSSYNISEEIIKKNINHTIERNKNLEKDYQKLVQYI